MELNPTPLEITIFLSFSIIIYVLTRNWKRLRKWWTEFRKRHRRPGQLRPRAPEGCPRCSKWGVRLLDRPRYEVVPWSEKKSRAGRPKRIGSSGFACVNPQCEYYGITDASIPLTCVF